MMSSEFSICLINSRWCLFWSFAGWKNLKARTSVFLKRSGSQPRSFMISGALKYHRSARSCRFERLPRSRARRSAPPKASQIFANLESFLRSASMAWKYSRRGLWPIWRNPVNTFALARMVERALWYAFFSVLSMSPSATANSINSLSAGIFGSPRNFSTLPMLAVNSSHCSARERTSLKYVLKAGWAAKTSARTFSSGVKSSPSALGLE